MRLVTYRDIGQVRIGAIDGDQIVALDTVAPDMLSLIDRGEEGLARAAQPSSGASAPHRSHQSRCSHRFRGRDRTWCVSA